MAGSEDLHKLRKMINAWNENRLDLFALSEPNEDMEFHGVMRFYFQEPGQKVATKCLRVSSTATTQAVIDALVEKFHPDLRMLSDPTYTLHEVHLSGEERQLEMDEKPLLVQLTWHNDNREGRFVLKRRGPQYLPLQSIQDTNMGSTSMKRKLSKRDKKKLEKRQEQMKKCADLQPRRTMEAEDVRSIYDEVPPTTFTRTISNPEIVMKKRRERQVAKLRVMSEGGSLKIYGPELSPHRLYVTLLVSAADRADKIVRDTLEKYGLDKQESGEYCLFEVSLDENTENLSAEMCARANSAHGHERPINDDEFPLKVVASAPQGNVVLHCRRRPADMRQPLPQRSRQTSHSGLYGGGGSGPSLVELNPDASEVLGEARVHHIQPNVTDVGSDRALVQAQSITLFGPYVYPRHCVLAYMDNVVTLTPCVSTAEIHVDGKPIAETTILHDGQAPSKSSSLPRSASAPFQNSLSRSPSVGRDSIPAIIELADSAEDAFLAALIRDAKPDAMGDFKLAPVYAIYMSARYRLNPHYHPAMGGGERLARLRGYLMGVAEMLLVTVQDHCHSSSPLVLWMSNASELLHLCKSDVDLKLATEPEPQEQLAEAVERAFGHLTACFRHQLRELMPDMLVDDNDDEQAADSCVRMLSSAMSMLRSCRLNAAFTIQLFSQLFHYVNMYLFNWLVSREGTVYCSRKWARRLQERLARVQSWAQRQGLELAAECHLDRITQALKLLEAPKSSTGDLAVLGSTCYKLNSVQVRSLLQRYICGPDESPVPKELIEDVIVVAINQADSALHAEGQPIKLEEDIELSLPFLLPEDGYSADNVKGLPKGLLGFLEGLQKRGLCRVIVQPSASGTWTVHFDSAQAITLEQRQGQPADKMVVQQPDSAPRLEHVSFGKRNGGIGLSIVQAQGESQATSGIYIKKVMPNSAAYYDGRLEPGDQLLKVNGHNLINITQEQAARIMASSGDTVQFEVAKRSAFYNGLARILDDQPPGVQPVQQQYTNSGSLAHQRFASTSAVPQGGANYNSQQRIQYYNPGLAPSQGQQLPHYHSQSRVVSSQYGNLPGPGPTSQGGTLNHPQHPHQQMGHPQAKSLSTSHIHGPGNGQMPPPPYAGHGHRQPQVNGQMAQRSPQPYNPHTSPQHQNHHHQQQNQAHSITPTPPYPQNAGTLPTVNPTMTTSAGGSASSPHSTQSSLGPAQVHMLAGDRLSQTSSGQRAIAGWQRDEKEQLDKMVQEEMVRLLRDEAQRLEQKEYLTDDEQRRYRMVKLELAYRSRLNENDTIENNGSTDAPPPYVQPVVNGNGRPTSHNSASSAESLSASSAAERARAHDQYFAAAESRMLADMKLQQHSHNKQNSDDAQLAREAQERHQNMRQHQLPTTVSIGAPRNRSSPQHQRPFDSINEIEQNASRLAVEDEGPEMTLAPATSTSTSANVSTSKKAPPPPPPKRKNVHFGSDGSTDGGSGGGHQMQNSGDFPPPPPQQQQQQMYAAAQVSPQPTYVYDARPTRTQVLGGQEVYRDPRQRRLEQQLNQKERAGNSLDGANLPFRDKMRLFAAQLGENAPKDRTKVSSAQRDIEQHQGSAI